MDNDGNPSRPLDYAQPSRRGIPMPRDLDDGRAAAVVDADRLATELAAEQRVQNEAQRNRCGETRLEEIAGLLVSLPMLDAIEMAKGIVAAKGESGPDIQALDLAVMVARWADQITRPQSR